MCVKNNTIICVARASNSERDCEHDLYCCLLPRCEALRACYSGFPIATVRSSPDLPIFKKILVRSRKNRLQSWSVLISGLQLSFLWPKNGYETHFFQTVGRQNRIRSFRHHRLDVSVSRLLRYGLLTLLSFGQPSIGIKRNIWNEIWKHVNFDAIFN